MRSLKNDLIIIFLAAIMGLACTTKVSEWILLNSDAEKYLLVYFHGGQVQEAVRKQHAELQKRSETVNFIFRSLNKEGIDKPYYALFYRNSLISEFPDYNSVISAISSPMRKDIANEILAGKLCVMLYLRTGDQAKDARGLAILKETVGSSPFKNIITIMELERNSTAELHFVNFLLNAEDDLKVINEPMLFGVFGKLRALEPLLAGGITSENIGYMIDFLTADCSCLIKDNLPGMSILCDVSWDDPRPALVNEILDNNPFLLHKYANP